MDRELFNTRSYKYVEKKLGPMAGVLINMRRMQEKVDWRVALARTARLYRALSREKF